MSSPETRRRAGAHRTSRSILGALLPSALAVLAVAALVTSLAVWRGQDALQPPAAASSTGRQAIGEAASPPPGAGRSPTAGQTSPGRSGGPATTPGPAPADGQPADPGDFGVQVVVLNQTARSGLAGRVAAALREKGWPVPAVGNFRGTVPSTTVYYPVGQRAAALALAGSLPTPPRTRPRFGNLSTSRLTVVVTADYPA